MTDREKAIAHGNRVGTTYSIMVETARFVADWLGKTKSTQEKKKKN